MSMLRNQVMSLIEHERIQTTTAKAKDVRKIAEKVITLGKRGDVHARRIAFQTVRDRELIGKVFGPLAERFRTRPGGYTRILKVGNRDGDAAPMALLELLPEEGGVAAKPAAEPKKQTKARQPKAEKTEAADDAKPAKKAKAEKSTKKAKG